MDEIKRLLDEEIKSQIQNLSKLESGSEKMSAAVDDVSKLYKLKIEESKNELEFKERRQKRIAESAQHRVDAQLKEKQLQNDEDAQLDEARFKSKEFDDKVKDRWIRLGFDAGIQILLMMFYGCWMRKGFKFEETGSFSSTTFKNLFNRFRPTK